MLSRPGTACSPLLLTSACVLTAVLPVAALQVCTEPTHLRPSPQAPSDPDERDVQDEQARCGHEGHAYGTAVQHRVGIHCH